MVGYAGIRSLGGFLGSPFQKRGGQLTLESGLIHKLLACVALSSFPSVQWVSWSRQ